MKVSKLSKLVGAGVIAASLAVVPLSLPVQAQDNAPGTSTQQNQDDAADPDGPIADGTERDNNDWGWLGLLGLTGLAGLARKNRKETVHHVDSNPDVVVRPGSDYRS